MFREYIPENRVKFHYFFLINSKPFNNFMRPVHDSHPDYQAINFFVYRTIRCHYITIKTKIQLVYRVCPFGLWAVTRIEMLLKNYREKTRNYRLIFATGLMSQIPYTKYKIS